MFYAENITDLPQDIHETIFSHITNGEDFYNYKNTCKVFKKTSSIQPIIYPELFEISIILTFLNCDIKKHETICKKFSNLKKDNENEDYKLHYIKKIIFDRTHKNSIFDTQTVVYINTYVDNISVFKQYFNKILKYHNFKNYEIKYKIKIYFNDNLFNSIINSLKINYKKNIIISNKSLNKIDNVYNNHKTCFLKTLDDFEDYINFKFDYVFHLKSSKLFIKINDIIQFLSKKMLKEKSFIDDSIEIIDTSNNLNVINETTKLLQEKLINYTKYNDILSNINNIIYKDNSKSVKRNLEAELILSLS